MRRPFARPPVSHLVLLLALPSLAGLAGTLLPAFGFAPVLGHHGFSLDPWRRLFAEPGLLRGLAVGTAAGVASTLLALSLTHLVLARAHTRGRTVLLGRLLAPLLAVPHASFAVGFAFLVAPSGLLLRLLSPWATGLERPPDWLFPADPWGLSLTLGLALRETPFLLFAGLAALARIPVDEHLAVARSLGHGETGAWLHAVLPQLQRALRLPALAVLAYGCSVVDMALVLGPSTPPTFAVTMTRLALDPDPSLRLAAAAGAVLQLLAILAAAAPLLWLERATARVVRGLRRPVAARPHGRILPVAGALAALAVCGSGSLVLLQLGLWSLAGSWRFPAVLPDALTLRHWAAASPEILPVATRTLVLAAGVAALATAAVVPLLRRVGPTGRYGAVPAATALLWLPLLLPQLAFLPGLQLLFLALGLDGTPAAVAVAHFVFVLPYVLLVAKGPFEATPARLGEVARCLGAGPAGAFLRADGPLLARPLLAAFAVGASVSVALYLPTLLVGAGRVPTLATETVAFTLAGDRRLASVAGLLLAVLPALLFLLPFLVPDRLAPGGRERLGEKGRETFGR